MDMLTPPVCALCFRLVRQGGRVASRAQFLEGSSPRACLVRRGGLFARPLARPGYPMPPRRAGLA